MYCFPLLKGRILGSDPFVKLKVLLFTIIVTEFLNEKISILSTF